MTDSSTIPMRHTAGGGRDVPARFARSDWFRHARFGMFIHWGVYSIPGRGEWVRSHEELTMDDYEPWVRQFDPQHADFEAWASLAAEAGMEYAVFTAKHHDGYCLFDTRLTDYSSVAGTPGRDFVAEFLAAFRAKGIRVGLYFSLLDWSHPDYPVQGDEFHPQRYEPANNPSAADFGRYLDFMHGQVEEICTRYGKLDILWFDFAYGDLRGEAWRATELVRKVRGWQPDVVMDNRLEVSAAGFGSIVTHQPSAFCGDFVSPEQLIPAQGILGEDGAPVPWEACITLNNHWAWHHSDDLYKDPATVVRKLVEVVSKGGNLLLAIGPDADGVVPVQARDILQQVGRWLKVNERSVRGAGPSSLPKPEWGRWTHRAGHLYAHVTEQPVGPLALTGLQPSDVGRMRLLAGGRELRLVNSWLVGAFPDMPFVSLGEDPAFTYPLPDPLDTVIEIELDCGIVPSAQVERP